MSNQNTIIDGDNKQSCHQYQLFDVKFIHCPELSSH